MEIEQRVKERLKGAKFTRKGVEYCVVTALGTGMVMAVRVTDPEPAQVFLMAMPTRPELPANSTVKFFSEEPPKQPNIR